METAFGRVKSLLAGLGVTLSAGYFAKFIEGSYAAQASMLRLSQTAGTTVEAFSSLKPVMRASETDAESVALGMQKLAKSMAESGDGTTKAAKVFDALKVSVKGADGQMRSAQDVMREIGGKLSLMKDQTLAVAFAQEIFGKSGAQLIPFLYELAKAGELQAKVTTEQAKAAKAFEDNLGRLKSSSEQFRNHLANEMLPTLSTFLEKLLAIKQVESGGFIGLMAKLGIDAEQTANPIKAVDELEKKVADLQRRWNELSSPTATGFFGQFAQLQRLFNSDDIKITEHQIEYAKKQIEVLSVLAKAQRAKQGRDPNSPLFEFEGGGIPTEPKNPLGQNDALVKRYETTLQSLNKQYFDLTHSGAAALIFYETEQGTLRKLDSTRKQTLLAMAKQIDAYHALLIVQDEAVKSVAATYGVEEKAREVGLEQAARMRETIEGMQLERELIGRNAREIEKANAARQIELEVRRDLAKLPRDDTTGDILTSALPEADRIRARGEAQKRAVRELIEDRQAAERDWVTGAKNAFNEYTDDALNAAKQTHDLFINTFRSMEDAIFNFVKTGKLDFKSFAESVINDIIRMQIRMGIAKTAGLNFGSLFGGNAGGPTSAEGLTGGTFAEGGRPPLGRVSLVGERGPELFVPDRAGTIFPNGSFGGVVVQNNGDIHVHGDGGAVTMADVQRALMVSERRTVAAVRESMRR